MKEIDNTPIEDLNVDWGNPDGTGKKAKSLEQVQAFLKKKLNEGYKFISTATPTTTPVTLTGDEIVFYIATEEGDYANFGLSTINELSVIKSDNGSWKAESLGVPIGAFKKKIGSNLVDPDSVTVGYYVYIIGGKYSLLSNSMYNSTPIIDVKPNTMYYVRSTLGNTLQTKDKAHFVHTFDSQGIYLRKLQDVFSFTTKSDEVGVAVTFFNHLPDQPINHYLGESSNAAQYSPIGGYFVENISDNSVTTEKIAEGSVTTEKIAEGSVTTEKIADKLKGIISRANYRIYAEYKASYYNLSNFISPIPKGTWIKNNGVTMILGDSSDLNNRYDILNGEIWQSTFDIALIRTRDIAGTVDLEVNATNNTDNITDITYFFLPKHIYVAAGRTIELYYEQMLLNAHLYNIQAKCSIGAALERKFQIIGDAEHLDNYTLTISIYDNNGNKLKEATSTIHVVSSEITHNIALLPIGDSLTNQKPWLAELANLSNNKIISLGTRGSIAQPHEGRSGGSVSTYMSVSGNSVYSFDHSYIGVGSDSDIFSTAQSYSIGDYCKYGNSIYVFITEHPAGAWDINHVYNITEGNPFYDWETKAWSFTKYKQRNNINPDIIMIYLGTNGINLTPETNNNGALGIKKLIDKIRLEDADTPIIVVNTIFRSGQNGIGKQGNTDGYTAQSEYKFSADRKVLLLAKALENMIGDYPNVYLCPVGFTHDSKYNFGNIKKAVNPRLDVTEDIYEIYPNESVHPQNAGYMQMADCMFSTICAI